MSFLPSQNLDLTNKKVGVAHQDSLFSGDVWRITEQLVLRHSQQAGRLSDQNGVVEPVVPRSGRDQVLPLKQVEVTVSTN